jgi:hypothetical protein
MADGPLSSRELKNNKLIMRLEITLPAEVKSVAPVVKNIMGLVCHMTGASSSSTS